MAECEYYDYVSSTLAAWKPEGAKYSFGQGWGLQRRMGGRPGGPVWVGRDKQPPFNSLLPKTAVSNPDESGSRAWAINL